MAPDFDAVVFRKLSTVTIMVPIGQVTVSGWLVFLKPSDSLGRDPWVNQGWRVGSSNIIGMDILFYSLMECGPMKDTG